MRANEINSLRRYIAYLQRRQYDLMPLSENRHVAKKLAEYLAKYHLLTSRTIIARAWMHQDQQHDRLDLGNQISHLLDLANSRVGDNCNQTVNVMLKEKDYFNAHHATALADSAWDDARNVQRYVHAIGRAMKKSYQSYQHRYYYRAYVNAYQLRHLLSLAKPVQK